ncbi:MAG: hypothetical protein ACOY93_16585 [Bacillota bacterium]
MGKKNVTPKKNSQTIWVVAAVSVVAVGLLIGISLYTASRGGTESARPNPVAGVVSDKELGAVRNVKGSPDAKVTVTEFNDYL